MQERDGEGAARHRSDEGLVEEVAEVCSSSRMSSTKSSAALPLCLAAARGSVQTNAGQDSESTDGMENDAAAKKQGDGDAASAAGAQFTTQFTCFTSTKVHILTRWGGDL